MEFRCKQPAIICLGQATRKIHEMYTRLAQHRVLHITARRAVDFLQDQVKSDSTAVACICPTAMG